MDGLVAHVVTTTPTTVVVQSPAAAWVPVAITGAVTLVAALAAQIAAHYFAAMRDRKVKIADALERLSDAEHEVTRVFVGVLNKDGAAAGDRALNEVRAAVQGWSRAKTLFDRRFPDQDETREIIGRAFAHLATANNELVRMQRTGSDDKVVESLIEFGEAMDEIFGKRPRPFIINIGMAAGVVAAATLGVGVDLRRSTRDS